jgi:phosphoglucosamine mutase
MFGTDGVRGPAGSFPFTPESLVALGRATAAVLLARRTGRAAPRVLMGRDSRPSGPMVAGALTAGLQAGGASVDDGGLLPTPAVALLTAAGRYDLGVVVSASHNAAPDNGLKFLGADGAKVDDAMERAVEEAFAAPRNGAAHPEVPPAPGRLREDAAGAYIDAIVAEFRGLSLRRVPIVVDAAQGAASRTAPEILRRLGAEVIPLHADAAGERINDRCGALHPESCGRAVRRHGARLGLALDGDADRLTLLDEKGHARDGDDVLAALAPRLASRGLLPGDAVAGTVMCNGGLDPFLMERSVRLVRTHVGDRHVAAAMRREGLVLGAEPSGHVLLGDRGTVLTSDGVVTALRVLVEMRREKSPLSCLLDGFRRVPRAEAAVPVARRADPSEVPALRKAVAEAEAAAGPRGRVLVRPSGTEPRMRILVEAPTRAAAVRIRDALARAIAASLGSA